MNKEDFKVLFVIVCVFLCTCSFICLVYFAWVQTKIIEPAKFKEISIHCDQPIGAVDGKVNILADRVELHSMVEEHRAMSKGHPFL